MSPLRYGSVCSGIEAASVAWHPLGWRAAFLSEIDPFPRAVLAHHWPDVPLHGDFTTIEASQYEPIDLLVGGTPCQSFSVAGLRSQSDDGELRRVLARIAEDCTSYAQNDPAGPCGECASCLAGSALGLGDSAECGA